MKEYLINYLKRKDMILLSNNGIIIDSDDLDEYIDGDEVMINFHD